jgi:hypothetical protein
VNPPSAEENYEERKAKIRAEMRAEERAHWRSMAWKIPLFGIPILMLLSVVLVLLGLWMNLLIGWARSLLHG